jgi:SAM-dependent methyltransferase
LKHRSDPRILDRRTLERDHRTLARLLCPDMRVLDIGCGTGAITAGIARVVGQGGLVVGMDRDASLLVAAPHDVHTVRADAAAIPFKAAFDVVTAARTLQWIADAARVVHGMAEAACPAGLVVVLDYNHAANDWEPEPPVGFRRFYRAFLEWRQANGWDNNIADHLSEMFVLAGLIDVESCNEDESTIRGDAGFEAQAEIWAHVIETVGPAIVTAGFLTAGKLNETLAEYRSWAQSILRKQTLRLSAVVGRRPSELG